MPNSKKSHTPDIAPLKIVEFYEKFKDAMKDGDFARGRECLRYMRQYQGGEKLAKELEQEFEDLAQEGIVFDDVLSEEELAQQVLSHMQLCETFIRDEKFEQAWLEMEWIQKKDESLAYSFEKKIEKARRKFQKEQHKQDSNSYELAEEKALGESLQAFTNISEALKLSATKGKNLLKKYSKKLIGEDREKLEKLVKERESKELGEKQKVLEDAFYIAVHDEDSKSLEKLLVKMKKAQMPMSKYEKLANGVQKIFLENVKNSVFTALEEGRTTFASNLIKKHDFSAPDRKELTQAVEAKKQEKTEEKRLEKVQKLESQFQDFIGEKNFKKAQGCLTKIATFGTQLEELRFQEIYEQALSDDKQELQDRLETAIAKNIADESFKMAERNLRDYKKIASSANFDLQKAAIQNGKQRSLKKHDKVSVDGFESTKHIQQLFIQAQEFLADEDYNQVHDIADSIAKKGDEEVAFSLRQTIKKAKQESQKDFSLQGQFQDLLDDQQFDQAQEFLAKNIESSFIQKSLEEKLVQSRVESEVQKYIERSKYDEARKVITAADVSVSSKAALYLKLDRVMQSFEKQERDIQLGQLESEISSAIQSRQYDSARELLKQFETLQAVEKSLHWQKEIRQAEINEQVRSIEEDVSMLKSEGRFDEALELSKKMLELEQESAFEATRSQLKQDEALFEKHKQEALFAHVCELFYQGKNQDAEDQRDLLTKEQNLELDALIQQRQEQEEQDQHRKKIEDAQKLFFTLPLDQKQSFVEEIQFFVEKDDLEEYYEHIEEEKEKEVQKLLLQVEDFFDISDFENIRSVIQKVAGIGGRVHAESLLSRCLEAEKTYQKELLDDHRNKVFGQLGVLYGEEKFTQFFQMLLDEQELFLGDEVRNLQEKIIYWLEEQIVLNIEQLDFVAAQHALDILHSFDEQVASMLNEILKNKKQERLEKMNLVGAKEAVKKRTALLHYNAWKQDYIAGRLSPVYREHIHNLGEKNFAKVLEGLEAREGGGAQLKEVFLESNDLKTLEKLLRENFYDLDFISLEGFCHHFASIWSITTKEEYKKDAKQLEKELQALLDKKDFDQSELLFDEIHLESLDPNDVLRLYDQLDQRKQMFDQESQEKIERKIFVALEQKDWDQAKQLCVSLELPQYLEKIEQVLETQKAYLFDSLYSQWKIFTSDIRQSLEDNNFARAWKDFEKAEEIIPFEIFQEERGGLIQEMFTTFEKFIHQEKLKIHEAVQNSNLQEAQILIQSLEELQKEYDENYAGAIGQEENFQRTLAELKSLLKSGKSKKVDAIIQASKDILSSRQVAFLKWFVDDFEERKKQEDSEALVQEFLKLLEKQDLTEAQSLIKRVDNASQKSLMESSLEQVKKKQDDQKFLEEFQLLLSQDFHNAEALLQKFSGEKKLWLECFIKLQKLKKQALWFRFDNLAKELRGALIAKTIKVDQLQELEEIFLENLICTGGAEKLSILQELFDGVSLDRNVCEQESFYSFLDSQEWDMAQSFVEACSYQRLAHFLQGKLVQTRQEDSQVMNLIKKSLSKNDFDTAKKQLRNLDSVLTLEDVDATYKVLLEQEAQAVEDKRKNTIAVLVEDLQMLIQQEKFDQIDQVFEKVMAIAQENEKEKIRKIRDDAQEKMEQKKRAQAKVDAANKKAAKKQYEKFVFEALNGYNPQEARTFYQELQNLGGGENDQDLLERIEQQEQEVSLLEEIAAIQSYDQVLELEKKLVKYQQKNNQKAKKAQQLFEERKEALVQELIKQKQFEEAEKIITTL